MSAAVVLEPLRRASHEARLDECVTDELADAHGHLRGGQLLQWMEVVGMLAATRHCKKPAIAAAIDDLGLRRPILVGERVYLVASVTQTAPRSAGVTVSLHHGGHAHEAHMTFVAPNADGYPGRVPQLASGNGTRPRLASLAESCTWSPDWEHRASYVHALEPVRVGGLVFRDTLHGGALVGFAIEAAKRSASAHLGGAAVRLSGVRGLSFSGSPPRDLFLHLRSVVVHVDERSLTALVDIQAEDPLRDNHEPVLRALLTHTPIHAARIAALDCGGDLEQALFREVAERLRRAGDGA